MSNFHNKDQLEETADSNSVETAENSQHAKLSSIALADAQGRPLLIPSEALASPEAIVGPRKIPPLGPRDLLPKMVPQVMSKTLVCVLPEKMPDSEISGKIEDLRTTRTYYQKMLNGDFAMELVNDETIVWQYISPGYWVQIELTQFRMLFKDRFIEFIAEEPPPFKLGECSLLEFIEYRTKLDLKDALQLNRSKIEKIKGLNFQNCFLNLETNSIITDKNSQQGLNVKKLMLTQCLPYDYDPTLLPSTTFFKILLEIFDYNLESLFKFRCLLKICIEGPFIEIQTGFLLWGSPASGKSTIVNYLMALVSKQETSNLRPKEFDNEFTLHTCVDKRLVVLSEVSFLQYEPVNNIKMLTGRDPITPNVKFSNIRTTRHFEGVMVMTTNSQPEILAADAGLISRFVDIETRKITSQSTINLASLLKKETAGIINWALAMPLDEVPIRAEQSLQVSKFSSNVYVSFMAEHLTFDPNGLILVKTLGAEMAGLDMWKKKKQAPSDEGVARQVVDLSNVIWNISLEKIKRKK